MSISMQTLVPNELSCFGWIEKERCYHCRHFKRTGNRLCYNCQDYGAGEQNLCVNCAFEHEFTEGLGGANRTRAEVLPSYWFNLFTNIDTFNDPDEEYVNKVKRCCRILVDIIRNKQICPEYLSRETSAYEQFMEFLAMNRIVL